jgi:hypothetical protein
LGARACRLPLPHSHFPLTPSPCSIFLTFPSPPPDPLQPPTTTFFRCPAFVRPYLPAPLSFLRAAFRQLEAIAATQAPLRTNQRSFICNKRVNNKLCPDFCHLAPTALLYPLPLERAAPPPLRQLLDPTSLAAFVDKQRLHAGPPDVPTVYQEQARAHFLQAARSRISRHHCNPPPPPHPHPHPLSLSVLSLPSLCTPSVSCSLPDLLHSASLCSLSSPVDARGGSRGARCVSAWLPQPAFVPVHIFSRAPLEQQLSAAEERSAALLVRLIFAMLPQHDKKTLMWPFGDRAFGVPGIDDETSRASSPGRTRPAVLSTPLPPPTLLFTLTARQRLSRTRRRRQQCAPSQTLPAVATAATAAAAVAGVVVAGGAVAATAATATTAAGAGALGLKWLLLWPLASAWRWLIGRGRSGRGLLRRQIQ